MRAYHRDRITATALLAFAIVWCVVVWQTIPVGSPGSVGPRAFPLGLGILLAVLSGLLLVRAQVRKRIETAADEADDTPDDSTSMSGAHEGTYLRMVFSVFAVIVAYGFLMEKIGFQPVPFLLTRCRTLVTIPAMMMLVLGIRDPLRIAGMAFGMTFGCWLVFGKLLGAYLPPGTWLSLF